MLKNPTIAVILVTCYLVIYYMLFHANASFEVLATMFIISPLLLVWMVVVVLKYGKYNGRELKEEEEWGYEDTPRDRLGTF
jgi:hypothetical protein